MSRKIEVARDGASRPDPSEQAKETSESLKNNLVHSIQMIEQRIVDIESNTHKQSSKSVKQTDSLFEELMSHLNSFHDNIKVWSKEAEAKNMVIFKEISTSLKTMKTDISKNKADIQDSSSTLQKRVQEASDLTTQLAKNHESLKSHTGDEVARQNSQIKHLIEFVSLGRMELEKVISDSLKDSEFRSNRLHQRTNDKLIEINAKTEESIFEES